MSDPTTEIWARTFEWAWEQPRVPTPRQLADWLESRQWQVDPEWFATIIRRLRAWPAGMNYPLIPDDQALEDMHSIPGELARWWRPGAVRGDLARLPRQLQP